MNLEQLRTKGPGYRVKLVPPGAENEVVGVVAIQIDSEMVGEMYLRQGPQADISSWIENVVRDYLQRTADEGYWSETCYHYRGRQADTQNFACVGAC